MGMYDSTLRSLLFLLMVQATPHVAGVICSLLSDPALHDVAISEIMSQILIQADKNTLASVANSKLTKKTINAVVQMNIS